MSSPHCHIGFVLHAIVPLYGMKFDMLAYDAGHRAAQSKKRHCRALGRYNRSDIDLPGGQIASMVDKPVTAFRILYAAAVCQTANGSLRSVLIGLSNVISGSVVPADRTGYGGLPAPFPAVCHRCAADRPLTGLPRRTDQVRRTAIRTLARPLRSAVKGSLLAEASFCFNIGVLRRVFRSFLHDESSIQRGVCTLSCRTAMPAFIV